MPKPPTGWFRWDFGLAGVVPYAIAIIVANLDKDFATISFLVLRQSVVTFFLSSSLMGFALQQTAEPKLLKAYLLGVLVPAVTVACTGFLAHWYFTNETRNVLVPFLLSLILNFIALTLSRRGHGSFEAQLRVVIRTMFRNK